jgi:hypothetical protein
MIIRAKYPEVGNEYGGPQARPQGFGSLYGGNHNSIIESNISPRLIEAAHG